MKLFFLKQDALDMLNKDISNNIVKYTEKDLWIKEYFESKGKPNYFFNTGIEVEDYQLKIGGPETDFENSKILYNALAGHINQIQASDLRLWSYLTHVINWEYMVKRWNIDISGVVLDEKKHLSKEQEKRMQQVIDRIGSRYFFKASKGKAFVRQGIARLYWSAYLTYDKDNDNPFEYTEYFFSKQDIFTSVTERSFARNKVFILAALKQLKSNPQLSRDDIRLYLQKLNQAGAITVIDFLDKNEAESLCRRTMDEILNIPVLKEGSAFKAFNNSTAKQYGKTLTIKNGKVYMMNQFIKTQPSNLVGKKEGFIFKISNTEYIVNNILNDN